VRRERRTLIAGALVAATACGKGEVGISPQQGEGNPADQAIASEQQTAEHFAVSELLAALSAVPESERKAAVLSLSEAQRQALVDYFTKASSMDASVSGTVNGQPYPAAWLAPDEGPAAPALPDPGALQPRGR
jgi:hypothetical protein